MTGCSRWLLVQPSHSVKEKLEEVVGLGSASHTSKNPTMPHLALLSSSEAFWRDYLSEIEEECQQLVGLSVS